MPRLTWNVPCTAHKTDGSECHAWSIRGGRTCRVHGSMTKAARAAAEFRLLQLKRDLQFRRKWARALSRPISAESGLAVLRAVDVRPTRPYNRRQPTAPVAPAATWDDRAEERAAKERFRGPEIRG